MLHTEIMLQLYLPTVFANICDFECVKSGLLKLNAEQLVGLSWQDAFKDILFAWSNSDRFEMFFTCQLFTTLQ